MKKVLLFSVSVVSLWGTLSLFAQTANAAATDPTKAPVHLETCFSPNQSCNQKIVAFINIAQKKIDMAIYTLSLNEIRDALLEAQKRGVQIRIVCDHGEAQGRTSQIGALTQAGLAVKYGNEKGLMHDKFTIIDGQWLETGSYNYSYSASNYNAENQIYLKDSQVITNYQQDFENLWSNGLPVNPSNP